MLNRTLNFENYVKWIFIYFTILCSSCYTKNQKQKIDTQLLCSALGTIEVLKYLHIDYDLEKEMVVYCTTDYFTDSIKKCNDIFPTIYIKKYIELPRKDDRKHHLYISKLIENKDIFDLEIYYPYEGVIFNIKMQTLNGRTYVAKKIDVAMF